MQPNTIKAVEDTVLGFFIAHKKPLTVMEIRSQCFLSETIIRKVIASSTKLHSTKKDMPIMSKEYPGRVHQTRSIDAFIPKREWLVELIKTDRRELDFIKSARRPYS